jgi:hypothetical protein
MDIRAALSAVPEDLKDRANIVVNEADALQDNIAAAITSGLAQRALAGYDYYREILSYISEPSRTEPVFYTRIRQRFSRQILTIDAVATRHDPQLAMTATTAAYRRGRDAFLAGDLVGLRTALISYPHIWHILAEAAHQDSATRGAQEHLLTSLFELTEFLIPHGHSPAVFTRDAAEEAVWTFVEIVKRSLDTPAATGFRTAFAYHANLYRYGRDAMHALQPEISAGTVALLAWILHPVSKLSSDRCAQILEVTPKPRTELNLYSVIDALDTDTGHGRWHEWERAGTLPIKAHDAEIVTYAAHAVLILLAAGRVTKPTAPKTSAQAQSLRWLLNHAAAARHLWTVSLQRPLPKFAAAKSHLAALLVGWDQQATSALWSAPLNPDRVTAYESVLRQTLAVRRSLTTVLRPVPPHMQQAAIEEIPYTETVDKDYFVDVPNTITDPKRLGRQIAAHLLVDQDIAILDSLTPTQHTRCKLSDLVAHLSDMTKHMEDPLLILPVSGQIQDSLGLTPNSELHFAPAPEAASSDATAEPSVGLPRPDILSVTLGTMKAAVYVIYTDELIEDIHVVDRATGPFTELLPPADGSLPAAVTLVEPVAGNTPIVSITGRQRIRIATRTTPPSIVRVRVDDVEW